MPRLARSPWFAVTCLALLIAAPLIYASCARTNTAIASTAPAAAAFAPPTSTETLNAMLLAGLDASSICAVGVAPQGMAAFAAEFRDDFAQHGVELTQAELRLADSQTASDALRRRIQSGKGTAEDMTAYQAAMAQLEAARGARSAALAACRAGAEATLSQDQRAQLGRIRANRQWELPTEFLLVDRTETQWVALRDALANEKIAPRYGDQTAPEHVAVLATACAHADVASARMRLQANLATTQSALTAAFVQ